jgi:uncharacterized membrane protein YidH (DUF202 family)
MSDEDPEKSSILFSEAQLILAEKRTSLAVMRLGIAVLALPITVLSFLIVTSKYYEALHVLHFLIPLIILILILIMFGAYLVIKSIFRMRHYDKPIHKIKIKSSLISEVID